MRARVLLLATLALAPSLAQAQPLDQNPYGHSPIRYHLDDSNLTLSTWWYGVRARQAFDLWEEDLQDHVPYDVKFERVNEKTDADVELWFRDAPVVGETCGNATQALGCANFSVAGRTLIEIKMQREDGAYYSYRLMGDVLRHEIGHALGLPHSANPRDIMFAALDTTSYADAQPPRDLRPVVGAIGGLLLLIVLLAAFIVRQARKGDDGDEDEG